MSPPLDRRQWLTASGVALASSLAERPRAARAASASAPPSFSFCLNTSTIRNADGKPRPILEQVQIAAEAGYDAIEPWTREVREYADGGGSLPDLRKRIEDAGLTVESAIGFSKWIVDDEQERAGGLESARADMRLMRAIGGKRLAAPPVGATGQADLNLRAAAERYRALLELGDETGVVPELELWGFSKSMSRLGELAYVAVESGHPAACLLPDVYHIYKGGSDFAGLRLLNPAAIHVFHINDYPSDPPRDTISDADRVFPGDGVAPLGQILRTLRAGGGHCVLSLELFNRGYWKQDPLMVARTGLQRMRVAVEQVTESER